MSRRCRTCGTPPTPYYKDEKNSLTQDHAAIFTDTKYAAGVVIKEEFVIPAINEDIQVWAKNLTNVVVGSYIWNPAYGYLKIVHWDSCLGKIGLLNDDIDGAAIPGTVVSEGSLWAVTARPCCADQDNFQYLPFLAEDYVIPAVNDPVTLSVTSTFGLIEGTNIRIGSNVYLLDQINSSLEIIVTNEGAGGTPGDTVSAQDVNGDLQYLITQAIVSPCSSPGADVVKLVGCDGANQAILEGDFIGQVPVLIDPATEEVAFYLLDTEVRTCTFLTLALTVVAATPSYTIEVDDESIFNIGDILQIDFGALRWEVTDNTTPGELDITCTTGNPGSNFVVPLGSSVCLRLTTEAIQEEVDAVEVNILVIEADIVAIEADIVELQTNVLLGWVDIAGACFYNAANIFEIVGDVTANLKIGQKFKIQLSGADFYGNVESFAFGSITAGRTAITIITNTDYVLTNNPLTVFQISLGNPQDFPAFFNYTISPSGYSVISFQLGMYSIIDGRVVGQGSVLGTSNSTGLTVRMPCEPENIAISTIGELYQAMDNGVELTTIGQIVWAISGTLVDLVKDQTASATWTNANLKGCVFKFSYIMNQ